MNKKSTKKVKNIGETDVGKHAVAKRNPLGDITHILNGTEKNAESKEKTTMAKKATRGTVANENKTENPKEFVVNKVISQESVTKKNNENARTRTATKNLHNKKPTNTEEPKSEEIDMVEFKSQKAPIRITRRQAQATTDNDMKTSKNEGDSLKNLEQTEHETQDKSQKAPMRSTRRKAQETLKKNDLPVEEDTHKSKLHTRDDMKTSKNENSTKSKEVPNIANLVTLEKIERTRTASKNLRNEKPTNIEDPECEQIEDPNMVEVESQKAPLRTTRRQAQATTDNDGKTSKKESDSLKNLEQTEHETQDKSQKAPMRSTRQKAQETLKKNDLPVQEDTHKFKLHTRDDMKTSKNENSTKSKEVPNIANLVTLEKIERTRTTSKNLWNEKPTNIEDPECEQIEDPNTVEVESQKAPIRITRRQAQATTDNDGKTSKKESDSLKNLEQTEHETQDKSQKAPMRSTRQKAQETLKKNDLPVQEDTHKSKLHTRDDMKTSKNENSTKSKEVPNITNLVTLEKIERTRTASKNLRNEKPTNIEDPECEQIEDPNTVEVESQKAPLRTTRRQAQATTDNDGKTSKKESDSLKNLEQTEHETQDKSQKAPMRSTRQKAQETLKKNDLPVQEDTHKFKLHTRDDMKTSKNENSTKSKEVPNIANLVTLEKIERTRTTSKNLWNEKPTNIEDPECEQIEDPNTVEVESQKAPIRITRRQAQATTDNDGKTSKKESDSLKNLEQTEHETQDKSQKAPMRSTRQKAQETLKKNDLPVQEDTHKSKLHTRDDMKTSKNENSTKSKEVPNIANLVTLEKIERIRTASKNLRNEKPTNIEDPECEQIEDPNTVEVESQKAPLRTTRRQAQATTDNDMKTSKNEGDSLKNLEQTEHETQDKSQKAPMRSTRRKAQETLKKNDLPVEEDTHKFKLHTRDDMKTSKNENSTKSKEVPNITNLVTLEKIERTRTASKNLRNEKPTNIEDPESEQIEDPNTVEVESQKAPLRTTRRQAQATTDNDGKTSKKESDSLKNLEQTEHETQDKSQKAPMRSTRQKAQETLKKNDLPVEEDTHKSKLHTRDDMKTSKNENSTKSKEVPNIANLVTLEKIERTRTASKNLRNEKPTNIEDPECEQIEDPNTVEVESQKAPLRTTRRQAQATTDNDGKTSKKESDSLKNLEQTEHETQDKSQKAPMRSTRQKAQETLKKNDLPVQEDTHKSKLHTRDDMKTSKNENSTKSKEVPNIANLVTLEKIERTRTASKNLRNEKPTNIEDPECEQIEDPNTVEVESQKAPLRTTRRQAQATTDNDGKTSKNEGDSLKNLEQTEHETQDKSQKAPMRSTRRKAQETLKKNDLPVEEDTHKSKLHTRDDMKTSNNENSTKSKEVPNITNLVTLEKIERTRTTSKNLRNEKPTNIEDPECEQIEDPNMVEVESQKSKGSTKSKVLIINQTKIEHENEQIEESQKVPLGTTKRRAQEPLKKNDLPITKDTHTAKPQTTDNDLKTNKNQNSTKSKNGKNLISLEKTEKDQEKSEKTLNTRTRNRSRTEERVKNTQKSQINIEPSTSRSRATNKNNVQSEPVEETNLAKNEEVLKVPLKSNVPNELPAAKNQIFKHNIVELDLGKDLKLPNQGSGNFGVSLFLNNQFKMDNVKKKKVAAEIEPEVPEQNQDNSCEIVEAHLFEDLEKPDGDMTPKKSRKRTKYPVTPYRLGAKLRKREKGDPEEVEKFDLEIE